MCGLSAPPIQRMVRSNGVVRGKVDWLMRLFSASEAAGVELIADGAASLVGGRGVRAGMLSTTASGDNTGIPPTAS